MLKKLLILVGILVAVGVIVVAAGSIYIYVSGGSGEASEEISAPTLVPRTAIPTDPADEMIATETTAEDTEAVPDVAEPTTAPATTDLLFRIVPEESEVRFILQEDLRGVRTTVVGRTNQVAGDILVDQANPSNSMIGTVRVNVRTITTDQEMRNRAIRSQILESAKDEYEFSQFVPKRLEGMPASVEIGTPFTFTIIGDLTVRDITREVIFEAEVMPVSETRIEGSARAVVFRKDFDLQIPNVPSVANVTDEVALEIDFVATRVED